ncbi:MAG: FUSC family protein, partial [Miltoncostaeaceae bacterium]
SPNPGDSLETGVLRTLGTLAGGMAAVAVVALAGGSDAALIVAFCVAAFAMMAFKDVNYAVFVLFLTAVLVLMQGILGADAGAAAEQRLLATLLGAAIAFAALWIGLRLVPRGRAAPEGADG